MLSDRPLSEVLDRVAARTPAPGGGSSAAWSCALGAGLVAMAASFAMDRADGRDRMAQIRAEAEGLRAAASELAERDLASYVPLLEALRLPLDDPARAQLIPEASALAAEVPLQTARLGATVARLGADVALDGNAQLRGDAVAGTLLAEAGCRAAACLVRLNLRDAAPEDGRLRELEALVDAARAASQRAVEGC